ncbi:hypothetical protein BH11BAC7_BH11BAC7_08920 [soil metagenome]
MTPKIIALIVAGIGGLILLALQESIKEIIKKLFSGLNSKQVTLIFIVLIGFTFGVIYITGFSFLEDTPPKVEAEKTVITNNPSDAQVYSELAKTGLNEVKELSDKKHIKDSVRIATREKQWFIRLAYQKKAKRKLGKWQRRLITFPIFACLKNPGKVSDYMRSKLY